MSLSTFLIGKKEKERKFQTIIKKIQPDRSKFKTLSDNFPFSNEFTLKAPNNLSTTSHAIIVGITFDYLARFRIAQKIENEKDRCYKGITAEYFFWRFCLDKQTENILKEKFDKGINHVIKFVNSNDSIDKDLIHYSYFFGRLEQCWRSGKLPNTVDGLLNSPYEEIEDDLINLVSVFDDSFLNKVVKTNSHVIFNPEFGDCSNVIRGADADIFIDGVLYDFKTTKHYSCKTNDIRQIISYYLFNKINIKLYDTGSSFVSYNYDVTNVNKIAIYLARYGEINYLDIESINSELIEKTVEDILDLFKDDFMSLFSFTNNPVLNGYFNDKSKYTEIINRINRIKQEELLESQRQYELRRLKKEKEEKRVELLKYRQNEIVMITESGTTFHTNEKCWALRNSNNIKKVTINDAIKQGKGKECKLCY